MNDAGEDLVEACPHCDGTKFKVRVSSVHKNLRTGDPEAKYKCGECGATFDEPNRRESFGPGAASTVPRSSSTRLTRATS